MHIRRWKIAFNFAVFTLGQRIKYKSNSIKLNSLESESEKIDQCEWMMNRYSNWSRTGEPKRLKRVTEESRSVSRDIHQTSWKVYGGSNFDDLWPSSERRPTASLMRWQFHVTTSRFPRLSRFLCAPSADRVTTIWHMNIERASALAP